MDANEMVDYKQFRGDAAKLQVERSKLRSTRETTGTTKAIRAALPHIYGLREDGVQWAVIAAALAAQGIVQGKARIPLTTNRLTALVRQIELQNQKRAAKTGVVRQAKEIAMQNHALSVPPVFKTKAGAIVGEEARPPRHRRNQPTSQATDSQEAWSEQAQGVGAKAEPENGNSRKPREDSDVAENPSGRRKGTVKLPGQTNRDLLAYMDRARAVRRRQD